MKLRTMLQKLFGNTGVVKIPEGIVQTQAGKEYFEKSEPVFIAETVFYETCPAKAIRLRFARGVITLLEAAELLTDTFIEEQTGNYMDIGYESASIFFFKKLAGASYDRI